MKIFEALQAPIIAAMYKESPYNKMPYVGETIFPEKRKSGLTLSWIQGAKGLPVQLKNSNFDSKSPIRDRVGFTKSETGMFFFKEAYNLKEQDRQELLKMAESPNYQQWIKPIIDSIYDDEANLIESARVTKEIMRMQILSTGKVSLANNNVFHELDYSLPAENKETLAGADLWSDPTADVITQITEWQDTIETSTGIRPTRAIVHKDTFKYLRANAGLKILAKPGDDPTKVALLDKDVMRVLADVVGIEIIIYSKKYKNQSGGATDYFPTKIFTLLPPGTVGNTWNGTTPEEVDLMSGATDAQVTVLPNGVAITTYMEKDPVKLVTKVSNVSLPSAEGLENIFIATVLV